MAALPRSMSVGTWDANGLFWGHIVNLRPAGQSFILAYYDLFPPVYATETTNGRLLGKYTQAIAETGTYQHNVYETILYPDGSKTAQCYPYDPVNDVHSRYETYALMVAAFPELNNYEEAPQAHPDVDATNH